MGGHVGAKKIPTNRQKQLHAARAVATRDLFNNAACQSRIQHQWTARPRQSLAICSTMRLGLMPLLSSFPYWSTLLPVCSALLCSASTLPEPDVLTCCLEHTLTLSECNRPRF